MFRASFALSRCASGPPSVGGVWAQILDAFGFILDIIWGMCVSPRALPLALSPLSPLLPPPRLSSCQNRCQVGLPLFRWVISYLKKVHQDELGDAYNTGSLMYHMVIGPHLLLNFPEFYIRKLVNLPLISTETAEKPG